jgi:hypothetical protein
MGLGIDSYKHCEKIVPDGSTWLKFQVPTQVCAARLENHPKAFA